MRFNHAECRLCGSYLFEIEDLIAYTCSNVGIVIVKLNGQQPWAGIHCICKTCFERLANEHLGDSSTNSDA